MTVRTLRAISRAVLPLLLMGLWEVIALRLGKPTVLPSLEDIAAVLLAPGTKILITGSLMDNTIISLVRVIVGFVLASGIAIPLGLMMGHFLSAERFFDSTIEILRPIPPLAWVPLILAWFGIKGVSDLIPPLAGNPLFGGIQFSTIIIIFIGALFSDSAEHDPRSQKHPD
jgi:NitT/TauT family transport system permease protein